MYRHILVATDGSELSARAVAEAVKLARCTGAKLTAFYAAPPYVSPYPPPGAVSAAGGLESYVPPPEWDTIVGQHAERVLADARRQGETESVTLATRYELDAEPWKAILATAEKLGCDCIVMASHGRRGLEGLVLGSETTKVLTHGKLPVMVVH
jgi:nucleotide-binding universal stress UspA family protein